jgi:hypothetical protein
LPLVPKDWRLCDRAAARHSAGVPPHARGRRRDRSPGPRADRSKGASKTHDAEHDPGHHVDLADGGTLHGIENEGSCKKGDPQGITFATEWLAVGAALAHDMIVEAWLDSANTPVGCPMVNVRAIEGGTVRVTRALFRAD